MEELLSIIQTETEFNANTIKSMGVYITKVYRKVSSRGATDAIPSEVILKSIST